MTAVVETATRPQVLRESAAALNDRRLTTAVEDLLRGQDRIVTAFERLRLVGAVEEFLRANEAAGEAADRGRLTDAGGWGGYEDEAERLYAVAEDAWYRVEPGVAEAGLETGGWARNLLLFEEAESASFDYVGRGRRRSGHDFAVVQSGPVDWSKGRAA
jgi:hypothetical protein